MTVVVEENLNKRFRSIDGSDDHCDTLKVSNEFDNEILRIAINDIMKICYFEKDELYSIEAFKIFQRSLNILTD
jgi:hypothetical protein